MGNYYDAKMWCERCAEHVRYLQSTEKAYCTECGGRVQLLGDDDIRRIRKLLGGRSKLALQSVEIIPQSRGTSA